MKHPVRLVLPFLTGVLLFATPCLPSLHALSPVFGSPIFGTPAFGIPADEPASTATILTEMETRAAQAEPRERCFLYTELLHGWTEFAGRSLAAGDAATAATAIEHADANAQRLKSAINRDSKRLKNAELLMGHSVHRLSDILRASTLDQREALGAVLHRFSDVHNDLLAAVFAH